MGIRYVLFLGLLPLAAQAQLPFPTFLAQDTVTIQCPWDSTQTILSYTEWEAYQTLDGTWNGPRDSTICLDLAQVQNNVVRPTIQLDQCDVTRPVFVRALLDSTTVVPLDSNQLYTIEAWISPSIPDILDTGSVCLGGSCTGLNAAVRVPDSVGTGSVLRWYQGSYDPSPWSGQARICLPTERFEQNDLREFIFKLTPTGNTTGQKIYLSAPFGWTAPSLARLTEQTLPTYQTSQTSYFLQPWNDFLVMYTDTTYPDAAHVSYLDVAPSPNTPAPSNVSLELSPGAQLVFQPFTQFRAGAVLNNDSVFHNLTLINAGGDICLAPMIVELIWEPGDRYLHQAGHLYFEGARSCFLFNRGSTMEVAPGSTLHYGIGNRGMLALRSGCTVRIGNGGEMRMSGMVVLTEGHGATGPEDLYSTIGPGAKLTFLPGARIHNANSMNSAMRWIIHVDGGEVDLSGLSTEDRQKIVLVDLPSEELTGLTVISNDGTLTIMLASRNAGNGQLRIFDAAGRCIHARDLSVGPGPTRTDVPASEWNSGAYLVVVQLGEERRVGRWVKS